MLDERRPLNFGERAADENHLPSPFLEWLAGARVGSKPVFSKNVGLCILSGFEGPGGTRADACLCFVPSHSPLGGFP